MVISSWELCSVTHRIRIQDELDDIFGVIRQFPNSSTGNQLTVILRDGKRISEWVWSCNNRQYVKTLGSNGHLNASM